MIESFQNWWWLYSLRLGGGTRDIVAHLVGSNNYLNEISPSYGGNFGSNEIDKSIFKDIILKLFGCHDFNTFYRKYKKKIMVGMMKMIKGYYLMIGLKWKEK